MEMKFEVKYNVPEKEWNDHLKKSKDSTAFQSHNWAMIYEKGFGSLPVFIYVKNSNDEVLGQLLASIHSEYYLDKVNTFFKAILRKLNFKILRWKYGPIIHDENFVYEIHSKILEALDYVSKKNKVTAINGRYPAIEKKIPNFINLLKNYGYLLDYWSTSVINLKDNNFNELFDSFDKKTRYDLRKAENNNLTFEVRDDIKSLEQITNMKKNDTSSKLDQIDEDHNISENLYDEESIIENLGKLDQLHHNYMQKNQMEKIFFATKDGVPIAGIRCIIFNKNIIQQGVTTTSKGRLLQAGSYVTWNAIKWAIQNTFSSYDMGGINPSNNRSQKEDAIAFYKAKWQGKIITYPICKKICNNSKYNIFRVIMVLSK